MANSIAQSDHVQFNEGGPIVVQTNISEIANNDFTIELEILPNTGTKIKTVLDTDFFKFQINFGTNYILTIQDTEYTISSVPTTGSKEFWSFVYEASSNEVIVALDGVLFDTISITGDSPIMVIDQIAFGGDFDVTENFDGNIYFSRFSAAALYDSYPYSIPTDSARQIGNSTDMVFWMNFQAPVKRFTSSGVQLRARPATSYVVTRPNAIGAGTIIDSRLNASNASRQLVWSDTSDGKWKLLCGEFDPPNDRLSTITTVSDTNIQITAQGNRDYSLVALDGVVEATGSSSNSDSFVFFGDTLYIGARNDLTDKYNGTWQEILWFEGSRDTNIESNQTDTYQI